MIQKLYTGRGPEYGGNGTGQHSLSGVKSRGNEVSVV